MHTNARFSLPRFILAGAVCLSPLWLHAGEAPARTTAPVERKDVNPFAFADGKFVLDLEARARVEIRSDNRDFADSINDPNDGSWVLTRIRLGVAVQPASWLKLYGQFQDSREIDSERTNVPGVNGSEGSDTDLRQLYAQFANFANFPLGLTVGRQRFFYGDGRLLGDPRWGNFGRTFDGVRLRYERKKDWVEAFAIRPVVVEEEVLNESDSADTVLGLYASTEALRFQTTEAYFIFRDKRDHQPDLDPTNKLDPRGSWNGPPQRIATVGTRWQSNKLLGNWDYKAEFAYQFGEVWANTKADPRLSHHAFAAHASGGYTWADSPFHPRLGLEYDYATGDHDPSDSDSQSFQNLFPSNHEKYGYMDEFGWRNIHDARVQFTVDLTKKVQAEANYHAFWLADTHDYWYRSNGYSTLRTKTPDGRDVRTIGAGNFAGHELDFVLRYNAARWLTIDAGYSHFFAGSYLKDTGSDDDADFGYVQAVISF